MKSLENGYVTSDKWSHREMSRDATHLFVSEWEASRPLSLVLYDLNVRLGIPNGLPGKIRPVFYFKKCSFETAI